MNPADWLMGFLGGLMIGGAAAAYLLLNGRIMGASGIFGRLIDGSDRAGRPEAAAFVTGMIALPALMAMGSGASTNLTGNVAIIVVAGLLVGIGTRLAGGCTSGHGVCGMSRLSPRSLIATMVYLSAGVVVMAFARHVLGLI
ncbi:MAG: hypothetical protein DI533_18735 [Cereibacter sphaeroides]|uniref:Sulphur transport domain-containing protein n=1 Tax=Cereibacter sphaeroides TaxID=1063 RepID=A0A2W5S6G2_CERSP|nr:MAG: hypothetical protein DI533_18735 [Cereibacter sphaeroides]